MSTADIKDLKTEVLSLKKALDKLGRTGIERQARQTKQLEELKTVIIEAHEKEKKRVLETNDNLINIIGQLNEIVKKKDAEIAELKKGKA